MAATLADPFGEPSPAFPQELGKAFDTRVRRFARLEPLPLSVPDPPPWDPTDPCAMKEPGRYSGAFRTWEPSMMRDVPALTERAGATLSRPFDAVPVARRHPML